MSFSFVDKNGKIKYILDDNGEIREVETNKIIKDAEEEDQEEKDEQENTEEEV